jgi:hypothetical protein
MALFEKDEKGNLKKTPKNTLMIFGGILIGAFIIYKILPTTFKK